MHLYAGMWKISACEQCVPLCLCAGWQKTTLVCSTLARVHTHSSCFSMCSLFLSSLCVFVHLSDARAYQHPNHICNSQQPPSRIVPISAYLHCSFFLFSSVHCFGLQLLYLFRLTGGLALPLVFRIGNGVAEKRVDNRGRRVLITHVPHLNITPQYIPPSKTNRTCSFPFLFISSVSHNLLSLLCKYSLPLSPRFFLFLSHSILLDSLPLSLLISPLSGLAERRSACD